MNSVDPPENDTEMLLQKVKNGDSLAAQELAHRYRDRIRRMVACRLAPNLAVRVDPSDIVQETMFDAVAQLPKFANERPIQFYPWLRNIAWQKLVKEHRRHVKSKIRSVEREEDVSQYLSDESQIAFADRFAKPQSSPSDAMVRAETRQRVKVILGQLSKPDQEILILRYLEQMSMGEVADSLGIREDTARQRHSRALLRFQARISAEGLN